MIFLSIITVNYNNCLGLKKTIDSVASQSFSNYEYIIIDGGSSDGSKDLIEQNADKITYWTSEKDAGVYNAMNKGITKAKGEYLLFLNSGDTFFNSKVLDDLNTTIFKEDIIYYDSEFKNDQTSYVHTFPDVLSFEYFLNYSLPHQATFIKRNLFDVYGLYDENYKIVSDWAFFLNTIVKHNVSYKHISKPLAIMFTDGISHSPKNEDLIQRERKDFLEKNFPLFLNDYQKYAEIQKKYSAITKSFPYKLGSKFKNIFKGSSSK